ncbi:hypothetical protein NC651_025215 [Populus alba x Populus x berolinensis]|nr:hypothetical protein NC651_025215 [Populus alba x Populus x berolinensis]
MFVDAQLELTKKSFKRDKSTSSSVGIAQKPIFSKGSSRVYISMKPSFHLQLKSGSPLPLHPEAVTSSKDEAFKE